MVARHRGVYYLQQKWYGKWYALYAKWHVTPGEKLSAAGGLISMPRPLGCSTNKRAAKKVN